MKVMVTGGAGWTGLRIARALAPLHEGVLLDPRQPSDALPEGFRWTPGDVRDGPLVQRLCEDVDGVVHLAVASGSACRDDPATAFDVNVRGTFEVLEAARLGGVQRVVVMGSAPVHLPGPPPSPESFRGSPGEDHVYDVTKRLQEELATHARETHGLSTLVLRAGHIVDAAAETDPAGRPLRDVHYCRGGWVDIGDLARAVHAALGSSATGIVSVVGASPAYEWYGVDSTERTLDIEVTERFADYPAPT